MNSAITNLQLLKLGGSLITDKSRPHTPRMEVLTRLAGELAAARKQVEDLQIILGHGSGSFGHVVGQKYGTRKGVSSREEWRGFAEVWREASALNRLVMDALDEAGLPAIALPPSASVVASDGVVTEWNMKPLQLTLKAGLVPVVFGDVTFDTIRGGTILSTEDLFTHIAIHLKPRRLLLAGLEPGVWSDFPLCQELVKEVTPDNIDSIRASLRDPRGADVTGGMFGKVRQSLELVEKVEGLEVYIFSGEQPEAVTRALSGEPMGTAVRIR